MSTLYTNTRSSCFTGELPELFRFKHCHLEQTWNYHFAKVVYHSKVAFPGPAERYWRLRFVNSSQVADLHFFAHSLFAQYNMRILLEKVEL